MLTLKDVKQKLAHRSNYGAYRNESVIEYIVIHYTGNDGDRAWNNVNYFQSNKYLQASAHLFVDDNNVYQSVPFDYVAYSVGAKSVDTSKGGGKFYKKCTNKNSINIEMCDTNKNGTYDVTEQTINNTLSITKELMAKYGIPASKVIRHFDVTGKKCPAYWIDNATWENKFHSKLTAIADGWNKEGNDWFYYRKGKMVKSEWIITGGKYYYMKSNGAMAHNEFIKSSDYNNNKNLYWVRKDGTWDCEVYRWKQDNKGWWIAQDNGSWYPKNEYCLVDGKYYYFDDKGYMVTGTKTIDGQIRSFDKNGVLVG